MTMVILMAALNVLEIAVSAVLGVLVMLVSHCMNWHDVARYMNVSVLMIVVSSMALGEAFWMFSGQWMPR